MPPTDAREFDLLQACPCCDYPLRGLPEEHACPECGVSFDCAWKLYGPKPGSPLRWRRRLEVVCALLLLAQGLGLLGVWILRGTMSVSVLVQVLTLIALPLGVLLLRHALVALGDPIIVGVGPRGISVLRGRRTLLRCPWDKYVDARYNTLRLALLIYDDTGRHFFRVNAARGWHDFELHRCVTAIHEYPRVAAQAS